MQYMTDRCHSPSGIQNRLKFQNIVWISNKKLWKKTICYTSLDMQTEVYCSYLSLDAFISKTASLYEGPNIALARHKILVVLPVPGGPLGFKNKSKLQYFYGYD